MKLIEQIVEIDGIRYHQKNVDTKDYIFIKNHYYDHYNISMMEEFFFEDDFEDHLEYFFNKNKIPYSEHVEKFIKKNEDTHEVFFIIIKNKAEVELIFS
jgi:hypothetical protein